ncbi:TonB family protein [Qipengyuania spongiae]|uniref:Energy transducer TonB n=1 Tax=Qipengyuania spongiae TaxID=2909673 RepID=A0ABY5T3B6_9SPHN|nr:TonB family protein [Qipengyuania spongiae]UVI40059.1 energy transducer TonB [Qipengyuania spongiae]
MRRLLNLILATFLVPVAHAPASAEKITLAPSSPWNVDYADESCSLRRTFDLGDKSVSLQLEQISSAPYFNLMMAGEGLRRSSSETMRIQFGPAEDAVERGFLMGTSAQSRTPFLVMFGVQMAAVPETAEIGTFPSIELSAERMAAITELTLSRGLRDEVTLQLGPMDKPMEALQACVTDLAATLGLDDIPTASMTNGRELARYLQDRFPNTAFRDEAEGIVTVRVLVDPEGKAKACQVARSVRPALFDDLVCYAIMQKAEFDPVPGADGEPTYAYLVQSVRFVQG